VGIPCVVAYLWVGLNDKTKDDTAWVILLVAFGSIMISGMIYSVLVESVSSVFIFIVLIEDLKILDIHAIICHLKLTGNLEMQNQKQINLMENLMINNDLYDIDLIQFFFCYLS
jgi:hypothetical protein